MSILHHLRPRPQIHPSSLPATNAPAIIPAPPTKLESDASSLAGENDVADADANAGDANASWAKQEA